MTNLTDQDKWWFFFEFLSFIYENVFPKKTLLGASYALFSKKKKK